MSSTGSEVLFSQWKQEKKHLDSYLKWRVLPGVVAYICHPTAQAAEAEGSKHQHQPEIQEPKANETAQWVITPTGRWEEGGDQNLPEVQGSAGLNM